MALSAEPDRVEVRTPSDRFQEDLRPCGRTALELEVGGEVLDLDPVVAEGAVELRHDPTHRRGRHRVTGRPPEDGGVAKGQVVEQRSGRGVMLRPEQLPAGIVGQQPNEVEAVEDVDGQPVKI